MTQEKLQQANDLIEEINRLKGLCIFIESKIKNYDFNPPTKASEFYLHYQSRHETTFNEAEMKLIHDVLRIRLKELTKEFTSL